MKKPFCGNAYAAFVRNGSPNSIWRFIRDCDRANSMLCFWENVNVKRSVITVPRSKSGEKRHVPIKSVAEKAFKSLLVDRNESGRVVPLLRPPVRGNGRRKRYSPRWFPDSVVQRSGITNFHWHDLRPTFASRLVMKGVPLSTVQELMGHKAIQMTVRYPIWQHHISRRPSSVLRITMAGGKARPSRSARSIEELPSCVL